MSRRRTDKADVTGGVRDEFCILKCFRNAECLVT